MTPTTKLRFVEREIVPTGKRNLIGYKTVQILQQWWASDPIDRQAIEHEYNGEWRNVPMKEQRI